MSDPKAAVGVVGASARAAVHSLARAGYAAWAVDLFNDRDLACPSARCPLDQYPRGIPALAEQFPSGPVLYTGGLENHPDVVAELAARRPLWGNPPAVLERVRDPFFPRRVWPNDDLVRGPAVRAAADPPTGGVWLLKPRRGAGGEGVRPADPADPPIVPEAYYFQEFAPGEPMSALFVGGGGTAALLAVTEQLVGTPWLHAGRFAWAGNVGPVTLPRDTELMLWGFGCALARHGGLVGLFGVDFQYAAGVAYPVEVNPRYPASAEVVEFATGRPVARDHASACKSPGWARRARSTQVRRVVGKAVYYAPFPTRFPESGPWDEGGPRSDPWHLPAFADIPAAGSTFEPGWPVFTLLEAGSSATAVRGRLQSRAADLDRLFAAELQR